MVGVFPARPAPVPEAPPVLPYYAGTTPERSDPAPGAPETTPVRPETSPSRPEGSEAGSRSPGGIPERPVRPKGRIVIVVDDAGYNLEDLDPFLKFPGPLSIAVLPGLPHSREAARRIKAAGKELLLHQPMEALGGENPGPGAIRLGHGRAGHSRRDSR